MGVNPELTGVSSSDFDFLIQVRVKRKWRVAHGLSNEKTLRKFLPRLTAEHGDFIRALCASRDARTGIVTWSVYELDEETSRSGRAAPGHDPAIIPFPLSPNLQAYNSPEAPPDDLIDQDTADADGDVQNEGLGNTCPRESNDNTRGPGLFSQSGLLRQKAGDGTRALASGTGRLLAHCVSGTKHASAQSAALIASTGNAARKGFKTLTRALSAISTSAGHQAASLGQAITRGVLVPASNRIAQAARALVMIAEKKNKRAQIQAFASRVLESADSTLQRRLFQWTFCIVLMSSGLLSSYYGTTIGGLAFTVLGACLIPPVKDYIQAISIQSSPLTPGIVSVCLVLLAALSLEAQMPERRLMNRDINYFNAHRDEILSEAQLSLTAGDYLEVTSSLERYLPTKNETVHSLFLAARPKADIERARQNKIQAQFAFDGSNRHLTDYIIGTLKDRGSYRHIKTDYKVLQNHLEVRTTFGSLNKSGMFIRQTIRADVSLDGKIMRAR